MSGRWWRAYTRARHDAKLLRLSDKLFRWWFNLLCVASDHDGRLPDHADLCAEFRVSAKAMTEILDALIEARLFDHDETGVRPHNWNEMTARGGRLPEAEWAVLRAAVFERDDFTCTYCGERGGRLQCDHVVPIARGGSNEPQNLTTACADCNRSKWAKSVEEWRGGQ